MSSYFLTTPFISHNSNPCFLKSATIILQAGRPLRPRLILKTEPSRTVIHVVDLFGEPTIHVMPTLHSPGPMAWDAPRFGPGLYANCRRFLFLEKKPRACERRAGRTGQADVLCRCATGLPWRVSPWRRVSNCG